MKNEQPTQTVQLNHIQKRGRMTPRRCATAVPAGAHAQDARGLKKAEGRPLAEAAFVMSSPLTTMVERWRETRADEKNERR